MGQPDIDILYNIWIGNMHSLKLTIHIQGVMLQHIIKADISQKFDIFQVQLFFLWQQGFKFSQKTETYSITTVWDGVLELTKIRNADSVRNACFNKSM